MLPPTERFSDRVADYVRSRPSYPQAAIDCLVQVVGLSDESVIADIGCGTGIFATQLLSTRASVVGIEPNESMRGASLDLLTNVPRFQAVDGTAEVKGLDDQSVDLISAAQAFHWFKPDEARQEFRRILRPEGWVALIWNERRSGGSPFLEEYEAILRECSPEYLLATHRNTPDSVLLDWYQNPDARVYAFDNDTPIDLENFLGRAYSSSYVPAAGTEGRIEITKRLTDLYRRTKAVGPVTMRYETKLFLGQLQPDLNRGRA